MTARKRLYRFTEVRLHICLKLTSISEFPASFEGNEPSSLMLKIKLIKLIKKRMKFFS